MKQPLYCKIWKNRALRRCLSGHSLPDSPLFPITHHNHGLSTIQLHNPHTERKTEQTKLRCANLPRRLKLWISAMACRAACRLAQSPKFPQERTGNPRVIPSFWQKDGITIKSFGIWHKSTRDMNEENPAQSNVYRQNPI
jgi:hypothetical protein